MNIEKTDNKIEESYWKLMKDEESKNKNYFYKAGLFLLISTGLYFYFDNYIFLYIGLLSIFSIFAVIYKSHGFKEGFKYGYLSAKDINISDYEYEKLIQD